MVGINFNLMHIFYKVMFKFFKYVNDNKKIPYRKLNN